MRCDVFMNVSVPAALTDLHSRIDSCTCWFSGPGMERKDDAASPSLIQLLATNANAVWKTRSINDFALTPEKA